LAVVRLRILCQTVSPFIFQLVLFAPQTCHAMARSHNSYAHKRQNAGRINRIRYVLSHAGRASLKDGGWSFLPCANYRQSAFGMNVGQRSILEPMLAENIRWGSIDGHTTYSRRSCCYLLLLSTPRSFFYVADSCIACSYGAFPSATSTFPAVPCTS